MMSVLTGIEPQSVFHYFEEISAIPRPSYHERAISDYLVEFAERFGLAYHRDELNNVVIIKEASEGCGQAEPLILQGHMDMVCEKERTCNKDMMREGLDLEVDGDLITAAGTTLGGDDGIALAYGLALLADETLRHPRLEVVFTVSEEVGMEGANGLDAALLKGRKLINIDSEEEGEMIVGCAGGGRVAINLPVGREETAAVQSPHAGEESAAGKDADEDLPGRIAHVHVTGLAGGHSGMEIDRGRANAVHVLADVLARALDEMPIRLITFAGGNKDNAIPREAEALVCTDDPDALADCIAVVEKELRETFGEADPDLRVVVGVPEDAGDVLRRAMGTAELQTGTPLTEESTIGVIDLIRSLPNGVQRMSRSIPGLVETSLNLGICELQEDALVLHESLRSSISEQYQALAERITGIASDFGASAERSGEYPAWEYAEESPLRELCVRIYEEQYHSRPKITVIHAGLECGLLADKMPGLDAVSVGPDILDVHTPAEHMSIASVGRVYAFLRRVIEESCS